MENLALKYYDIEDVKRNTTGYFFNKDTMSFFNSRVGEDVYRGHNFVYFVTSEKNGYNAPRFYTVRRFNCETRGIETVGNFQAYKSRNGAHKQAERMAKEQIELASQGILSVSTK